MRVWLIFLQAYKTINSDTERYESRLASMGSTAKGQFEGTHTRAHTHDPPDGFFLHRQEIICLHFPNS